MLFTGLVAASVVEAEVEGLWLVLFGDPVVVGVVVAFLPDAFTLKLERLVKIGLLTWPNFQIDVKRTLITYLSLSATVAYCCICTTAESNKIWTFRKHCSLASMFSRMFPSIRRSSSSVSPVV